MKKLLFLITYNVSLIAFCNAQNPLVKQWDKRFGGISYEELYAVEKSIDGGCLIGGWSMSDSSGDKTQNICGFYPDYWIVKMDSLGNKQWDKNLGGSSEDQLHSLQETYDHGYILGGSSKSTITCDKTQPNWANGWYDYWILKIDSSGIKQWDKRFGGTSDDFLAFLQQTSDKGFILGGTSSSPISGDKTQAPWGFAGIDYWIVKIDSLGIKQWDRRFGGDHTDWLYCLHQTSDGGFILGGDSKSGIFGDKTQSNWDTVPNNTNDYWVVKIDSVGNKQWDKRFGGTADDHFHSLIQTNDGGYMLAGISISGISGDKTQDTIGGWDYWIVKIDSLGNKQWDKDFGGSLHENRDFWENNFGNVLQTSNGGYLLSGNSESSASGDKTEKNLGDTEGWLVKIDSAGNKLWDKTILTTGANVVAGAIEGPNGCYTVGTYTNSEIGGYKTQPNWLSVPSYFDYWIIKFCECTVSEMPHASFTSTSESGCAPLCVTFSDNSDCYLTRQWLFPGGIPSSSTQQIPTVCYPEGGIYSVTLIVTNANGSDTLIQNNYIYVHPVQPTINVSGDTLTSSIALTYQWYLSDSLLSGATNQQYIATSNGYYYVCITDSFNCTACSDSIYINVTGIQSEINNPQSVISISPNPANEVLVISGKALGKREIEIYDLFGRRVLKSEVGSQKTEVGNQKTEMTINISKLSPGIYFLKAGNEVRKFVKE